MKTPGSIYGHVVANSLFQITLLVLLVAAGAYLYVPLRTGWQLKDRLAKARTELAELVVLYPLYIELARLEVPSNWPEMELPPSTKLSERDITSVPESFMQVATNCQMELGAVSPRVHVDEAGQRYLSVELRATGPYRQLKAFMLGLAQMPALERIDKLEIRREALQEQFNVVARMALE